MSDKTLDNLVPVDFTRSSRRYSALSEFDERYNPVDHPLVYVQFDQKINPTITNLPNFFDNARRSGASRISLIIDGKFAPGYINSESVDETVKELQFFARYLAFDQKGNLLLRRGPERLYEIIISRRHVYFSSDCIFPRDGITPWTKLLNVGKKRAEESSERYFQTRLKINLPADSGYQSIRCTLAPQKKFPPAIDLLVKNKQNIR